MSRYFRLKFGYEFLSVPSVLREIFSGDVSRDSFDIFFRSQRSSISSPACMPSYYVQRSGQYYGIVLVEIFTAPTAPSVLGTFLTLPRSDHGRGNVYANF